MGLFAIEAILMLMAWVVCAAVTVIDFRARHLGWAMAGLAVSGILLVTLAIPYPTHSVTATLPDSNKR